LAEREPSKPDGAQPRPGRSRPTIKDVAAAAGVSLKTVSRVLNTEPGVAASTVSRVQAAAAALGFQRDEAAANLRRLDRSTHLLGIVTGDVANPFYSQLVSAIEEVARQHGYLVIVASSGEDPVTEKKVLQSLLARRVDGLIVVPTGDDHTFLLSFLAAGTALVFVDRPALVGRVDAVVADNVEGAALATDHLLAGGHRRVAFLGDAPDIHTAAQRRDGYLKALHRAGVTADPALMRMGPHSSVDAEIVADELMAAIDPPTALICGNNRLTVGALRALRCKQRPVALVGVDDFELADLLTPGVTVVAQDITALGQTAAELLFRRLAGDTRPARTVHLSMRLIPRGSGELPPPDGRGRPPPPPRHRASDEPGMLAPVPDDSGAIATAWSPTGDLLSTTARSNIELVRD